MWVVDADGEALAAFVRRKTGEPWSRVKRWIETGKVQVGGAAEAAAGRRLRAGETVAVKLHAPRPRAGPEARIVFEDAHVAIIDKPAGVSSVPYEKREAGTAMDLLRDAWRRQGKPATSVALHVVHRIDKDTSGLIVFAKSKRAEVALAAQFRTHAVDRLYLCVAHGDVRAQTIDTFLVADRGDGLRGSGRTGKRAVTHVRPVARLAGATQCEVRLETGKTHQIRIHLAERGHPLVGERVYIRDFAGEPIASPRLLLHAATLGFAHPVTGAPVAVTSPLPVDFTEVVRRLTP